MALAASASSRCSSLGIRSISRPLYSRWFRYSSKVTVPAGSSASASAMAEADADDPAGTVTLEEYRNQREYSGRLMLRIPKELHRELAEAAKANGVSLNQYALYKLAR